MHGSDSPEAAEKELARRDISLYTVEDLSRDVAALKELGRL